MGKLMIIEGPRCSGKTTLAQTSIRFGYKNMKVSRGSNPFEDMTNWIRAISSGNENIIFDRFHLTEFVMGLQDGRSGANYLYNFTLSVDMMIKHKKWDTIILLPSVEVLEKRLASRNDGRGYDMPPVLAHQLWELTATLFDIPVFKNENDDDFAFVASFVERKIRNG